MNRRGMPGTSDLLVEAVRPRESAEQNPTSAISARPIQCANVLGIPVDAVDMAMALGRIQEALVTERKGYICMTGVHGIMEAQRNSAMREALDHAFMRLPDGMPTVWVGHSQRLHWMQRVTGPDLMIAIFQSQNFAQYSHFFYGGKPGIADELAHRLSSRFPWARIAGSYTPPFRDLTQSEEHELSSKIRKLKPSIVWVGISTPRQEIFMRRYIPFLETNLMVGVGAAFDFHTGRIRDSANWVKRAGLQWLHRLLQDPRHLLWRYLRNNPAFLCNMGLQIAGVRAGRRPSQPRSRQEDCETILQPACVPVENGSD